MRTRRSLAAMLAAVLGLGLGLGSKASAQGTMPPPSVQYGQAPEPVTPVTHQATFTNLQTERPSQPISSGTIVPAGALAPIGGVVPNGVVPASGVMSTGGYVSGGPVVGGPPLPGMPNPRLGPTGRSPIPAAFPGSPLAQGAPGMPGSPLPRGPMNGSPHGPLGPGDLFTTDHHPAPGPIPTELNMYAHPPYTIAAPDILVIDAIRLIPRPPYRIEALEVLMIHVGNTLPNQPITGQYIVSPEGTVNLGFGYGAVRIGGMTVDQAQAAIRQHLSSVLTNPQVTVAIVQFRGLQQIRGEHLVRPDGTISLGAYGSVFVAGMNLGQAKTVIERYLSQFLLDPQISIDVFAYNSKKYYVILDGGGFGQQVFALPATGNETVLSAISMVQGLAPVSSKRRIWLARPAPAGHGCAQVLPVDWRAITEGGISTTNYQIFPGDRVFVSANRLIALDNWLSMLLAPVERVFGITLLGSSTVNSISNGGSGTFFVP
jgi:polysaccharide export outer membrane protein